MSELKPRIPTRGDDPLRDWPEDFSHENGNYFCHCIRCGQQFSGYKRRIICKICSTADHISDVSNMVEGKDGS